MSEILSTLSDGSEVVLGLLCLYVLYKFGKSIQLVPNMEEFIVERFGKYHNTLGPGFHVLIPFIDNVIFKQDLRERATQVDPQECFTRDNVKVLVDGVIYLSIVDSVKSSYGITDFEYAAVQLAQTTTRSVIGQIDLDKTFEERERISAKVVDVLSHAAANWGLRVHRYEVKNITPPRSVQNSMEKQMTAERDRRAMIARAEGHRQAKINDSEGRKQELINLSLGEKQRRINEAEGHAQEILSVAVATANSIQKVGMAISEPNGQEAIQMQISQQYLKQMGNLATDETEVILPASLADFDRLLESFDLTKTS
jgi:regulator of protease activity HflC (stomatin/prohibitin superfamily)